MEAVRKNRSLAWAIDTRAKKGGYSNRYHEYSFIIFLDKRLSCLWTLNWNTYYGINIFRKLLITVNFLNKFLSWRYIGCSVSDLMRQIEA